MKLNGEEKEEKGIMDNKQDSQQGEQPGGDVKQKVDNTKNKVNKIKKIINFIRKNPLLAKILFWVVLVIIVIILFTMIIYTVLGDLFKDDPKKSFSEMKQLIQELNINADGSSGTGEENSSSLNLTTGAIIKQNPENSNEYNHYIVYGNYTDAQKLAKINKVKQILNKRNITIYSNQCLLFLAIMQENGLDLSKYKKEQLEAFYMFYKAEVATSALDLRTEEQMYENGEYKYSENNIVPAKEIVSQNNDEEVKYDYSYQQSDYVEDDLSDDSVCGTIRVQKVTYDGSSADGQVGKTTVLTYMPYEEFTSQIGVIGSDSRGADITKRFTIDENNNLIVAGWSYTNVSYDITCEGNDELLAELQEQNQGKIETNIYQYKSIPYLNYISKYTMPFDFFTSMLATTEDADFCKELAKIAETSYITITLHEEFSEMTITNTKVHNETDKLYAYFNGSVEAMVTTKETSPYEKIDISTYTSATEVLEAYGGTGIEGKHVYSGVIMYEWTYNNTDYRLVDGDRFYLEARTTTSSEEKKTKNLANKFITKDRKITNIPTEFSGLTILPSEDFDYETYTSRMEALSEYTKKIDSSYTIVTTTENEYNTYSMEVTEVNNWYEYYKKTYLVVETEDLGQPEQNIAETLKPSIINNTIMEQDKIAELDYVKEITRSEKERVIKEELEITEYTNPVFNINKVFERVFSYGNEEVTIITTGTKYKRTGDQKEIIQVKVQEGNQEAVLTISADALAVLKNDEEPEAETATTVTKEQYYGTTQDYTDSFLSIYNKYPRVQSDFNSIDDWTYEWLDSSETTINTTELLKYLLFLYDGTNVGVTEYNVEVLKPNEFKTSRSVNNAIAEVMKSYENEPLRLYMSGVSNDYSSVSEYVTQDRTQYKMYFTEFDGCLNFSYGIMVYSKNKELNNAEEFNAEGYDLQQLVDQYNNGQEVLVPVEVVDRIYEKLIKDKKETIKDIFEEAGVSIKSYELDALVNAAYQYGNCGQYIRGNNNITSIYKEYILGEKDYVGFFNNAVCQTNSGTVHFFITGNYQTREENNRLLFEKGIYKLSNGNEISTGAAVVEFALGFVGEGHDRFTSYNPTNGVADIWYGADWCAMFVSYCYNECALIPEPLPVAYAGCSTKVEEAKAEGVFIDRRQNPDYVPESGDIIFFTKDNVSSYHTGIVTGSDGIMVYTVEGNTGSSNTSPYWNGSHVEEQEYAIDSVKIFGYIPINQ